MFVCCRQYRFHFIQFGRLFFPANISCSIVEIKAKEPGVILGSVHLPTPSSEYSRQSNSDPLNAGDLSSEPYDGHHNDKDSLDQTSNRVCDWADDAQENEGNDVLTEMRHTIEDEFPNQGHTRQHLFLMLNLLQWHRDATVCDKLAYKGEAVLEQPNRQREDKSKAGGITQEIEFVNIAFSTKWVRRLIRCVEYLLRIDVL